MCTNLVEEIAIVVTSENKVAGGFMGVLNMRRVRIGLQGKSSGPSIAMILGTCVFTLTRKSVASPKSGVQKLPTVGQMGWWTTEHRMSPCTSRAVKTMDMSVVRDGTKRFCHPLTRGNNSLEIPVLPKTRETKEGIKQWCSFHEQYIYSKD